MSIFEKFDQKIRNMSTMLSRFGIDPVDFVQHNLGNQFVPAMRNCQFCPHGDQCSKWLKNAGEKIEQIPNFCPNRARFERTKAMMGTKIK